jgi:cell division transport system permease protein
LEEAQMRRLMTPWLGEHTDIEALPLPQVIDVTVDTVNPPNIEELNMELIQFVPMAILDSHRVWLDNLITIADGLMKLTVFILVLLIITTAFTVSYSAKTSLSMHKHVIALVHMMGANDGYIAWQYAIRILKLTLLGGLSGLVLALPIIFGVGYFFETIAGDFKCKIDALMLLTLISIPFIFALLAFVSTLKTVLTALKRMI